MLSLSLYGYSIKARLEAAASRVDWIVANVLEADLAKDSFDIWHDRAVFHFLTTEEERQAYVRQVRHAVKPGGRVIVATFAEDGPAKCSGLPVMRYSVEALHAEFGEAFELIHTRKSPITRLVVMSRSLFIVCSQPRRINP